MNPNKTHWSRYLQKMTINELSLKKTNTPLMVNPVVIKVVILINQMYSYFEILIEHELTTTFDKLNVKENGGLNC